MNQIREEMEARETEEAKAGIFGSLFAGILAGGAAWFIGGSIPVAIVIGILALSAMAYGIDEAQKEKRQEELKRLELMPRVHEIRREVVVEKVVEKERPKKKRREKPQVNVVVIPERQLEELEKRSMKIINQVEEPKRLKKGWW